MLTLPCEYLLYISKVLNKILEICHRRIEVGPPMHGQSCNLNGRVRKGLIAPSPGPPPIKKEETEI